MAGVNLQQLNENQLPNDNRLRCLALNGSVPNESSEQRYLKPTINFKENLLNMKWRAEIVVSSTFDEDKAVQYRTNGIDKVLRN